VTDRPTDHATRSVTIGRIYVCSTAMQPNNNNNKYNNKYINNRYVGVYDATVFMNIAIV